MSNESVPTVADEALITAPSFALQRKVGGPVARILTPERVKKAEGAVEKLVPPLVDLVTLLLKQMEANVRSRPNGLRDALFRDAHELRGLAGSANRQRLGLAANLICRYLEDTPADFQPDPALLSTITVVAMHACTEAADSDPMIQTLLQDAAKAVMVQRQREGRST